MIRVVSIGEKFMFCCVGGCKYHGIWFVLHPPKIGFKISDFLTFSSFAVFDVKTLPLTTWLTFTDSAVTHLQTH